MAIGEGSWSKMVKLTSGGFVTIQITGHPLDMAEEDRTFIEQIVDRVKEYEDDAKKYGQPAAPTECNCAEPGSCAICAPEPDIDNADVGMVTE